MGEPETVPVEAARALLLQGQGLLGDPERRATPAAVYREVERLGFVQVDTINVVERAHHHILHTRLRGYRPEMLARLVERDRRLFEHWTHDASLIPARWLDHWRPRFERFRRRAEKRGYLPRAAPALDHVRERIRSEGPLMSRDFERPPGFRSGGWWKWKPSKLALEQLWRFGELAIARREGFQKVFDLMERVHPELAGLETPEPAAHVDWACREALDRLGAATPAELRGFFGATDLKQAAGWCERAVRAGEAVPVRIEAADGSRPRRGVALPDWRRRAARAREAPACIRPLTPFDPAIRDRARTRRLFGFDYTIEVFVPAGKRRYGYYVLPLLEGDRLVGRIDLRLNREAGALEARGPWWEPGVKATRARRAALDRALERLAAQVGADRVERPRSRTT